GERADPSGTRRARRAGLVRARAGRRPRPAQEGQRRLRRCGHRAVPAALRAGGGPGRSRAVSAREQRVALAICVNPMSGRDVRRLAARATNMTHEAKRDIVARVAAGAAACGVTDLYVTREPYRIAAAALELVDLPLRVHVLEP